MTESRKVASPWCVYKFGGSSVANCEAFNRVVTIVEEYFSGIASGHERVPVGDAAEGSVAVEACASGKLAVVVSAMGGKPKVRAAERGDVGAIEVAMETLKARHRGAIEAMLPPEVREGLLAVIVRDMDDIRACLRGITITKMASPRLRTILSGYGEIWSAQILTAVLNHRGLAFDFLDARKVVVIEDPEGERYSRGPEVCWDLSAQKLEAFMRGSNISDKGRGFVITGYVASTRDGVATTLQRNGSDFTASIFGKLLNAGNIMIWTDVCGVLSADPRRVEGAKIIRKMSYSEAMELSYFGANVIHPSTMAPAVDKLIPIYIKNTFKPGDRGTCISASRKRRALSDGKEYSMVDCSNGRVKGFSTIDDVALINGSGMLGVPGMAQQLFKAMEDQSISVILIAQASSEHSICIAIPLSDEEFALAALNRAFSYELQHHLVATIDSVSPCSIIAAVGDDMGATPGICGQLFGALGRSDINIRAVSQGSSERNISVVIMHSDLSLALQSVHSAFFANTGSPQNATVARSSEALEVCKAENKRLREQITALQVRLAEAEK